MDRCGAIISTPQSSNSASSASLSYASTRKRVPADHALRQLVAPAVLHQIEDQLHLAGQGTVDPDGDREAVGIHKRHQLRTLAGFGQANRRPPSPTSRYPASTKEPSMKLSCSWMSPCSCDSCTSASRALWKTPSRTHWAK